jgi:hypothetical protein
MALRVAKSGGSIALVRTSTLSLGVSRRTKLKNPVTAQLFIAGWNYCQQHGRALCLQSGWSQHWESLPPNGL